ncbi:MAG: HD domain-containing protein [Candidatus Hadarchaeum sp.]|uniref:HD domain-containing protein n=1 Tax=Candidatus Hadarchaeum sp. TaxID=2883567 RepID=UPI003D10B8F3
MMIKYIRDPIHGYIGITDVERRIIDTWPVQRLRGIKQLSIASLVYPGGEHTRFSHSLGAMHVAGLIADSLKKSVEISENDWQLVRLASLLHDVGHGPFSHSYEELIAEKRGLNHEQMGARIVKESELADVLKDCGYSPDEIVDLAFGKARKRSDYLHQITASQVDSDKLDFLVRDSYYTGVEYGRIDINRLIQAMDVYGNDIAIDLKALYALEAFMIARYEMFLAVYYHHAVRSAEIMLHKAMGHADEIIGLTSFTDVNEFLKMDDGYVATKLRELNPADFNDPEKRRQVEKAKEIMRMLDNRKLLKVAYQRDVHVKDAYVAKLLSDKNVRRQKEQEIARLAGVENDDVVVDVPTLDSIPYYPREIDPMEIPVFTYIGGNKELVQLSRYSRLINVLKGYVDIIRVYTSPSHRNNVEKAAGEVFKTLPFSAQINM